MFKNVNEGLNAQKFIQRLREALHIRKVEKLRTFSVRGGEGGQAMARQWCYWLYTSTRWVGEWIALAWLRQTPSHTLIVNWTSHLWNFTASVIAPLFGPPCFYFESFRGEWSEFVYTARWKWNVGGFDPWHPVIRWVRQERKTGKIRSNQRPGYATTCIKDEIKSGKICKIGSNWIWLGKRKTEKIWSNQRKLKADSYYMMKWLYKKMHS